ncbi:MAG: hypothetical protein IJ642_00680 [Oscillospiraceae bacterium]|nr:hypothetical protein [Oscillospiraceae bacterium]
MKTLLDEFTENFVIITKSCVSDGEGGQITAYTESEPFPAAIKHDETMQEQTAEQQNTDSNYAIVTKKSVILNFPMIVKRLSNGTYFRITSDDSNVPPDFSSLDMRKASAEKIILPDE